MKRNRYLSVKVKTLDCKWNAGEEQHYGLALLREPDSMVVIVRIFGLEI